MKHQDPFIPTKTGANPFENCKLEREPYADILTSIVESYKDGFVMALDGAWGTGKTTFAKMWNQKMRNQGFKTVYFNAWENDYNGNPLVSIMAEFKTLEDDKPDDAKTSKVSFKDVLDKGGSIAKAAAPALLKAALKRYIDTDEIVDAISDATQESINILSEEINEQQKKKEGLSAFKEELKKYVDEFSGDKPFVFIIDELDRCRPNYAVEVLEQIKHIFSIEGIVFVLSIDKTQLGHAVRGVYGSESIDADEYLKRFIDLEYSLPEPNSEKFCNYLYSYFKLNIIFEHETRNSIELIGEKEGFLDAAILFFDIEQFNLRQQEKFFNHFSVVLKSFPPAAYINPEIIFYLMYLKSKHFEVYTNIKSNDIEPKKIVIELIKTVPPKILSNSEKQYLISYIIQLIFNFYCLNSSFHGRSLLDLGLLEETELLDKEYKNFTESFLEQSKNIKPSLRNRYKLSQMIDKIELHDNMLKSSTYEF
ncbi:P-loop NTPase fold protein [Lentimicrobium sp. S6]|uniref:KAP family P-loop NTPase fold protein n=1 Tax=Lentimicrobium sp. S6 TaxID=2735872 RepID=UPI0015525B61|nr:P-loop NTPase fold protein [Lentimicrobium sp. S6]NPD48167.1 hypothetical protein [Lentimicrobium sp. S6]